MEIIFEFFFEIYLELMLLIVPKEKIGLKRYYLLAVFFALVSFFGNLALLFWGGIVLIEDRQTWGVIPIVIALVWAIFQIILGFVLYKKKNRKDNEGR